MADTPRPVVCPVCGRDRARPVLELDRIPVQCTQILTVADEARQVPCGDVRLLVCEHCAHVWNAAFDPALVEYDGDYENSQFFSPSFQEYARHLADELVETYGIRDGTVVEIGSGKGEFLTLLCRSGGNRGIGYDPSYRGEAESLADGLDLRFVTRFFDEHSATEQADLVCARHVLEHIDQPVEFLRTVRTGMERADARVLYLEVPNASFTFGDSGLWDVIYQHCSYFSAPSLRAAVEAAGFEVLQLQERFDGQFLSVVAAPSDRVPAEVAPEAVAAVVALAVGASDRHRANVAHWQRELAGYEPGRAALWGAGAKGVMFLNAVAPGAVGCAIDVNPRKWGSFVPGTAQPVLAPEALVVSDPPDLVVVANARYEAEVRAQLGELGVVAPVTTL